MSNLINKDDTISRADAIRWVKTECNPYGKPTLDYDSGFRVIEHLKEMPPACRSCSNHPKNGGSGICHCILGGIKINV